MASPARFNASGNRTTHLTDWHRLYEPQTTMRQRLWLKAITSNNRPPPSASIGLSDRDKLDRQLVDRSTFLIDARERQRNPTTHRRNQANARTSASRGSSTVATRYDRKEERVHARTFDETYSSSTGDSVSVVIPQTECETAQTVLSSGASIGTSSKSALARIWSTALRSRI